ncbi:hypothetical protein Nepgr_021229 [Nepenthes gracilis]|uniref:MYB-CC type transcription factor LHEQLE-containing domain-containing protein n=1 Tax=Nepenthes gracilis TaxID=150966 RepID=A0AAD3SXS6_NEPGR|nr:hypothetical protein Nepgr_021229 [Nepenthes gracilis]
MNTIEKAPKPKPEAILERGAPGPYRSNEAIPEHLIEPLRKTVGMNVSDTHVGYDMFVDGMNTIGKAPKPKPEAILEPGAPEPSVVRTQLNTTVTFLLSNAIPEHLIIKPVSNTLVMDENDTHVGHLVMSMDITEALWLQMEVQKQLHGQLEVCRYNESCSYRLKSRGNTFYRCSRSRTRWSRKS